jgi:NADH dehydrogenase/NADH:ubiquinone oxidoreductase subunit G
VVAGEAAADPALLDALRQAKFVVVQAAYRVPWAEVADVLLPSPTMQEKSGTMVNAEGQTGEVVAAMKVRFPSEVETISQIAALLS